MKTKNKYNVLDECGRLIDKNVSYKRAAATVKRNPGATIKQVKINRNV